MFPLIKIRLYKIKNNPCINIFQYSLPLIYILLSIFYIFISIQTKPTSSKPEDYPSLMYNLFDLDISDPINIGFHLRNITYGVISKNEAIRIKMKEYFDSLNISDFFTMFSSYEEYYNNMPFGAENLAFEINKNEQNEYQCQVYIQSFNYDSFIDSYNTLSQTELIDPPIFYTGVLSQLLLHIEGKERTTEYVIKHMTFPSYGGNILMDDDNEFYVIGFLSFCYYFTCMTMISWMIEEKEKKLNQFITRHGINQINYLISWFVTFCVISFPIAIIMSAILNLGLFVGVCYLWLLFTFILFLICLYSYSFFFQSLFNKMEDAFTLSTIIYFVFCLYSLIVNQQSFPRKFKLVFMLFPQINLFINLNAVFYHGGVNVDFITKITSKIHGISLIENYFFFIISSIMYLTLGIFIMKYKESGFNFIFRTCIKKSKEKKLLPILNAEEKEDNILLIENSLHQKPTQNEIESQQNKTCLHIENICKQYGDLAAVNQFAGDFYPNEIFCFLGHNGAGKTTLIKMISGEEEPDNGDIYLNDISLIDDKKYLFQNCGLCPQDNIFFDYLTVKQHLDLIYELKEKKGNISENDDLLKKIGLSDKSNWICSTLSGGDKRKLIIALALLGNSKIILLDEPTSGLDIDSKRTLWEFLKEYKENKIILLTTHSLDEAEYVADKIGIMLEGKYVCSGSSSFLKSKFPGGYTVNFIFDSKKLTKEMTDNIFITLKEIDNTAKVKIKTKKMLSIEFQNINKEVNDVFIKIKELKETFPIINYTVSSTTLEDVFLSINIDQEDSKLPNILSINESVPSIKQNDDKEELLIVSDSKPLSWYSQILLNIENQLLTLWRNKITFCIELFSSIIILAILILLFSLESYTHKEFDIVNFNDLFKRDDTIYYKFFDGTSIENIKSSYYYKTTSPKVNFDYFNVDIKDIDPDLLLQKNNNKMIRNSIFIHGNKTETYLSIGTFVSNRMIFHSDMNLLLSYLFERDYGIKASFSPVIKLIVDYDYYFDFDKDVHYICILMIHISLILFGTYLVINPIKEKSKNIKHLYYLSGGNMFAYWLSFLLIDSIKYMIFILLITTFFFYFKLFSLYSIILVLFFIIPNCLYTYLYTFMFDDIKSGLTWYMILNVIIFVANEFGIIELRNEVYLYILFPYTMLFIGLYSTEGFEPEKYSSDEFFLLAYNIFIFQIILYALIIILCEKKILGKCFDSIKRYCFCSSDDSLDNLPTFKYNHIQGFQNKQNNRDYNKEQKIKIENDNEGTFPVKITDLSKTYVKCKSISAVKHLYIGLEKNEKFGLLGCNGSGKTTVFKAITNEIFFESGNISIFKNNVSSNFNEIRKIIGFCPQEIALFDYLTVNETLLYYQKLKNVDMSINEILEQYDLLNYKNIITSQLSIGNKRKLQFAIALLGNNQLLLLDEPSTGIDPKSRRKMWMNINRLSSMNKDFNMILSTHSIEEAEILCDTVSWLKEGMLVCAGNPEELKLDYSWGYMFHIKFNECVEKKEIDIIGQDLIKEVSLKLNFQIDMCIKYVEENPKVVCYLRELMIIARNIDKKIKKFTLVEIRVDFSFVVILEIVKEEQSELFSQMLMMKENNEVISELTISMIKLEDIFNNI